LNAIPVEHPTRNKTERFFPVLVFNVSGENPSFIFAGTLNFILDALFELNVTAFFAIITEVISVKFAPFIEITFPALAQDGHTEVTTGTLGLAVVAASAVVSAKNRKVRTANKLHFFSFIITQTA